MKGALVLACLVLSCQAQLRQDDSEQTVGTFALIECYTPNIICEDVSLKEYEGIVFCWKPFKQPPQDCSWVVADEVQGIQLYKVICDS